MEIGYRGRHCRVRLPVIVISSLNVQSRQRHIRLEFHLHGRALSDGTEQRREYIALEQQCDSYRAGFCIGLLRFFVGQFYSQGRQRHRYTTAVVTASLNSKSITDIMTVQPPSTNSGLMAAYSLQ